MDDFAEEGAMDDLTEEGARDNTERRRERCMKKPLITAMGVVA